MSIGDRLREIRKSQRLTAKELSERSGIPEKTIYRIETGEVKDPRISSVEPIIRALNCSADDVLMERKNTGLTGIMKNLFKRAETLPVKDKVMLIEIISKWIRSVKLEKVYRENIDEDILHIEDEINERSDDEFNEIVEIEKEAEYYSEQ